MTCFFQRLTYCSAPRKVKPNFGRTGQQKWGILHSGYLHNNNKGPTSQEDMFLPQHTKEFITLVHSSNIHVHCTSNRPRFQENLSWKRLCFLFRRSFYFSHINSLKLAYRCNNNESTCWCLFSCTRKQPKMSHCTVRWRDDDIHISSSNLHTTFEQKSLSGPHWIVHIGHSNPTRLPCSSTNNIRKSLKSWRERKNSRYI